MFSESLFWVFFQKKMIVWKPACFRVEWQKGGSLRCLYYYRLVQNTD